jgi:hypothetical protein
MPSSKFFCQSIGCGMKAIWHGSRGDIPFRRLMDYKALSR